MFGTTYKPDGLHDYFLWTINDFDHDYFSDLDDIAYSNINKIQVIKYVITMLILTS